jgi:hypothetical protein
MPHYFAISLRFAITFDIIFIIIDNYLYIIIIDHIIIDIDIAINIAIDAITLIDYAYYHY